jgi:serine protease Do
MVRKLFSAPVLLYCGALVSSADTIQLKEQASITGKVLSEKRDQVAVDVGYTVLVIPRSQIAGISKQEDPEQPPKPGKASGRSQAEKVSVVAKSSALYSSPTRQGPVRNVRDLVNLIGEAVVQVRTPSGLGSGFFINEEGFLITNFHVIEGETQISMEVYHQKDGQLERRSYKQVRIVAINKFEDLALLKIEDKDAPKFKFVTMGSADVMAVGERVFAIGSP